MDPIVDLHCHVVPDLEFHRANGADWLKLEKSGDGRSADVQVDGKRFRTVRRVAWDLDARSDDLALAAVQRQVISPMPELLSYWADASEAAPYCRALNEWIGEQVQTRATRFSGLGLLPMQDVGAAVAMVDEIAKLPLLGVEVGSTVDGVSVGSERFAPVFRALARAGLLVLVHSHKPCLGSLHDGQVLGTGVAASLDHVAVFAGLVEWGAWSGDDVQPKLIFSHGGGGIFGTLARMEAAWNAANGELPSMSPTECAAQLTYDSLFFDPRALRYALEWVDVSQIVIGSDYPFSAVPPGQLLSEAQFLSAGEHAAISSDNALKLIESVPAAR